MKYMKAAALALCLIGVMPAAAENWVPNSEGESVWIDTDSLKTDGDISSLDMRMDFTNGTVLSRLEFNPKEKLWRTAALVQRDETGKVMQTLQAAPGEGWGRILPSSYGSNILKHYIQTPMPDAKAMAWKEIYKSPDGQTIYAIDMNSLTYKDGYAEFWMDARYPRPEKNFSHAIYRVKMNMAYKKVMTLSATEYTPAGKVRLHAAGTKKWEDIPAATPIEVVFNYLTDEIRIGRLG